MRFLCHLDPENADRDVLLDRIPKGDASSNYLRTFGHYLRHVSNQLVVQEETVLTQI